MMDLKSRKAIYVRQQAPVSCYIHFICKGHLIYTSHDNREAVEGAVVEVKSSLPKPSPNTETGLSTHLRSQSVNLGQNIRVKPANPAQDLFRKVRSANIEKVGGNVTESVDNTEGLSTPRSRRDAEGNYDEWDRLSRRSHSPGSACSTYSDLALVPCARSERSESGSDLSALPHLKEALLHSSPPSVLDGRIDDALYDYLEQALAEAENSKREAFNEAVRRGKAEKDAIDAIRRAKASESLYAEESRQRKAIEEALAKEREELESMKKLRDEVMEELQGAQNKKSLLETHIEESNEMVRELKQKNLSAVELLQNYKKERDELQMERDSALREAEELRCLLHNQLYNI